MKQLTVILVCLSMLMLCACGAQTPAETSAVQTTAPTTLPVETTQGWPEPDKMIALTFDDGPSTGTMVEVLDLLAQYDAKATFFVIGRKIKASTLPVLQRAVDEGHEIGNHSYNHLHMADLTEQEIVKEYEDCQKAVMDAVGVEMYYFRAPFGSIDERVRRLVPAPFMSYGASAGDGTNESIAEDRAWRITSKAYDGCIALMHCYEGNDPTVEALAIILPELKAQGYKFVTLTQLYEEAGYELPPIDPTTSYKDNKPLA